MGSYRITLPGSRALWCTATRNNLNLIVTFLKRYNQTRIQLAIYTAYGKLKWKVLTELSAAV